MGARTRREAVLRRGALLLVAAALAAGCTGRTRPALSLPDPATIDLTEVASQRAVQDRTKGCVSCHVGQVEPHPLPTDPSKGGRFEHVIGCADCHGGDGTVMAPAGEVMGSPAYDAAKKQAHVAPKYPKRWETSRNPEHTATLLQHESWEFVRFVNPGDLRVAQQTCGTTGCHGGVNQDGSPREPFEDHVLRVQKSMMTHGAMLWGAALYNNGAYMEKTPRFGESYAPDGSPQRIYTVPAPTAEETARDGVLPFLDPLPRFEVGQPSNVLRIFERGARRPQLIGNPLPGAQGFGLEEEHGRPANRLSNRGFGTLNRTDPVWLNLQRTRLLDPTLNQLGTNDHPGDFRSSGCTACHMVYANDRDPLTELRQGKDSPANHSGPFAKYGHQGKSFQSDPTIPRDEEGHPIQHLLTRQIPSSQCIVCHMHPGTLVSNTYLGYTWWDLETDGQHFWPGPENDYAWKDPEGKPDPQKQIYPSYEDFMVATNHNPEGSTPKGLWNWREFLDQTGSKEFNQKLKKMQVGDFHGHGFIFRAVWKKDVKGNLLDGEGGVVAADDPDKWKKAVHLKDIHLERGMHCVDCHFTVDNHGNAKLYGEPRAATAIMCIDCHGSATKYTELVTTGKSGGQDLSLSVTPFGKRFRWVGPEKSPTLIQQSQVVPDLTWEVPQTLDSLDPDHGTYNEKSAFAKTVRFEVVENGERKVVWGDLPEGSDKLSAHRDDNMACYSCHTSWMASCFGCHLPMKANERREALHNEGQIQRNWTSYSFQTLRDDVFMLGVDGSITGAKVIPVRSACAVMVGSQNQNREWVYAQQQTISAEGFSGTAFSPHFPHTVRTTETKGCMDCHLSEDGDNNALMATLLMQGTNVANFLGRYIYVASGDGGFDAVVVSERDEPQAVIGSSLHKLAWPDQWKSHQERGQVLGEAYHHAANTILGVGVPFGSEEVHSLQMRGEYLYTANGTGGLKVYDVAQIDQKGFATRIVTAPVSPLGQRFYVDTKNATSVKAPSTQGVDPVRAQRPENEEQKPHLLYGFLYVTDLEEGLILVLAATLLEGDPDNNFLERNVTFNPDGILKGAVNCHVAGEHVYVLCDAGLVVVSVANPLEPKVAAVLSEGIVKPKAIEVQFRYGFLCDAEGMKVIDLTQPSAPRLVKEATVPLASAHNVYLSRAYAYVAAGSDGLVIVDVSKPEAPFVAQRFTAEGQLNDCRDVKIGMTNASIFAYIADGKNGLRVVEIASPERTPGVSGFHPTPTPELIATYPTRGAATAISQGIARDRAVDESGHQTAVFGRKGSRPFTKAEMERFYMHPDGSVWTVGAEPHGEKRAFQRPAKPAAGEEARK